MCVRACVRASVSVCVGGQGVGGGGGGSEKSVKSKSSDFHCASVLQVYVKQGAGRVPIRWMALESLLFRVYTHETDV